jgi:hypothetical protein
MNMKIRFVQTLVSEVVNAEVNVPYKSLAPYEALGVPPASQPADGLIRIVVTVREIRGGIESIDPRTGILRYFCVY